MSNSYNIFYVTETCSNKYSDLSKHSFTSGVLHLQKTTQLKKMLQSPDVEFIMEAHNGLSAKIVQEAGK